MPPIRHTHMNLTTPFLPPSFPVPSLASILQSWQSPAPETSVVLKVAHAVGTPILGAVWLGHCQDHNTILNGTYATLMLEHATADLAEVRTNLTAVTQERDDALAAQPQQDDQR